MTDSSSSKESIPGGVQYNPSSPLQNELSKIMRNFHSWLEPFNFTVEHFENLAITPALDIIDEKDSFKIKVEMPNMEKEDVKISIDDGTLVIEGEKTISKQDKDKNYVAREINWGRYKRNVALPNSVDIDNAKASFKNGTLVVDIPKKPESVKQSRVLEIENS